MWPWALAAVVLTLGLGAIWVRVYRRRERYVSQSWLRRRYRQHGDLEGRFWKGDDE